MRSDENQEREPCVPPTHHSACSFIPRMTNDPANVECAPGGVGINYQQHLS